MDTVLHEISRYTSKNSRDNMIQDKTPKIKVKKRTASQYKLKTLMNENSGIHKEILEGQFKSQKTE